MAVQVERRPFTQSPRPVTLAAATTDKPETRSAWMQAWRRLSRNPLAVLGGVIVLFWFWAALGADTIAPYRYDQFDLINSEQDPSTAHFLGTDYVGRDLLTLILYGSRVSVAVAVFVPAMTICIGVLVGVIAGYAGGWIDNVLMRFTDVMFAFPSLLFMVLTITVMGRSLWTILMSLGIAAWPAMARLVRGQVMQIKQTDYILSARMIGVRPYQIALMHVIPNLVGPVVVTASLSIPAAVAAEAFLTYIGIGVEPSIPSWGMQINDAQTSIFWHPTLILFPSLAVASLTLAFTFLGDGLRDALDPHVAD